MVAYIFLRWVDVWEGKFNQRRVAVKSLKEEGRTAQTFLTEASVMTYVNRINNLLLILNKVIDPYEGFMS